MSLYTRARKHIDMRRVKEMREEKIRKEVIAELERQQQEIFAELKEIESQESKSCDWRKELHERMTSSGTLLTTLPATGDVDIVNNRSALNGFDGQNHSISSAGTVTLTDDGDNDIADGTHTAFRQAYYTVDGSKSSHLKITISKGGGTSSWTDRGESWDDDVTLVISDIDNFHAPTYYTSNLTSGTHVIKLPGQYKNMRIQVQQFAKLASEGSSGTTRRLKIYNVSLQRRTPLNVFVGLDEPNSAAFVRDGDFERLSPTEKKKKLEEQLKASDEYLKKQFGEGMPRTATKIADVKPQQSFMDIQVGDQRITKVNNRTVTDTTRGIRGGKMDGRPIYTDSQGNMRVSQPKVDLSPEDLRSISRKTGGSYSGKSDRTSITNVPKTSTFKPYTDAEKAEKDFSTSPSIVSRTIRSATDQVRFAGDKMFQGNPAGRAPGLSNYWSPEPKTAATYSNPGKGKGIPGTGPNPTGTITTTKRPPGTPRVTRGITGTPQFKFPAGSPPPSNMLTQMADDAAVSVANKAAATSASKILSRAVPIVSIGIAAADAGIRASKGDYAGAVLSGLSAIPGPAGWAALGVQIATDAAGFTGGVKEQQEFDNYGDYIKDAGKIAKKDKIKIDRNAMLDLFLRELSKNNKLSSKDKEFLVAIFTDAEGLEKDDVITFVKKIQKKLTNGNSIKEQVLTEKKRLKSPKSIVDKIPGYYDGKPAPLGFPIEEPPKMKNGYHPDLVDGKKVSNRYNRLDPISAKSMPPTGNPHIDNKVKAARKKPK